MVPLQLSFLGGQAKTWPKVERKLLLSAHQQIVQFQNKASLGTYINDVTENSKFSVILPYAILKMQFCSYLDT